MRTTKYSILVAYAKIIEKYKGNYAYATTETLLDLLEQNTRVRVSRRTFFGHTRDLRKEGLIKTQRRYGRHPDGKIYNRASAVCITIKGYVMLAARGFKWALSMAKQLRKKYLPEKAKAAPLFIQQNIVAEKKEADTTKAIVQKVIAEGISLYDYLLNKGQRRMPLDNSIKPAAN